MSNDLRTAVTIDLQGNLERKAARYEKAMGRFSKGGQRHMRRLSKTAAATGRMLDRAGNRYTALLTGAAGAGAMRMLVGLETRFTRLGIQANKGADEMNALKREIYDVASAPDVRIDPGQLTSAVEQIVEKTGDLKFARDNLRNIALAIQAAGAEGASIGAIVSEFKKLGLTTEQDVLTALDTLVTQGKAGAFTLQHLANQGERAVSAFSAMGYEGQEAVQAMGALLQMSRMGTGSAEMATSAYENMLKVIIEKGKELQSAGINIFDPEKLKAGVEEFRPMPGIIKEIMAKSKGRASVLSPLFGGEGYRAITKAAAEYQKTGGFETLDKFNQIQGDGTKLLEDSARAAKTSEAAMQNLYTAWQRFADGNLTGPIRDMADALNKLDPKTVDTILDVTSKAALGVGGLILAKKLGVGKLLGGKKGAAGLAGGAAGMAGGVTPVYVVNLPGGGMDGMSASGNGKNGKKSRGYRAPGDVHKQAVRDRLNAKKMNQRMKGFKGSKYWGGNMHSQAAQYRKAGLLKRGMMVAGGTATGAAGMVAAAGAAGYGVGTLAYDHAIAGTDLADKIGESVARALAFFGNQEAKLAIEINDKRVEVKSLETKGFEADVDTGLIMDGQ
ncbi:MAG: hypothetical protein RPU91_07705 [Candidatus Sedimenticola sp. (ex Thyasira tokunagai)]